MDRPSASWLRARPRAGTAAGLTGAALTATMLAVAALAACGAGDRPTAVGPSPAVAATAIGPGAWLRIARPRAPSRPTWRIDPDEPLPRNSRWWPALAVARRFATADLSYEVDELGPAVRRTITLTCTAAFAAGLFAHRASLPPGVKPRQVSQRLVGVEPLDRTPGSAAVLATARSNGHGRAPGAFELRLVPRPGGWRVAGLRVV